MEREEETKERNRERGVGRVEREKKRRGSDFLDTLKQKLSVWRSLTGLLRGEKERESEGGGREEETRRGEQKDTQGRDGERGEGEWERGVSLGRSRVEWGGEVLERIKDMRVIWAKR